MSVNFRARRSISWYLHPVLIVSFFMLVWSGCSKQEVIESGETVPIVSEGSQPMAEVLVDVAEVYKYIDSRTHPEQYLKIQPLVQNAEQAAPENRVAMDYLLLAVQNWQEGDFASLQTLAQNGLDLKPADRTLKGHLFYMRGLGQGEAGDFKKAKGSYQNAMLYIPDYEPAILQMGWIYLNHDKNPKQAKTYFEMGLRRNPNRIEYYSGLGSLYESQADWAQAAEMYRNMLRLNPASSVAMKSLGSIYLIQKQYDQAEKMLSSTALSEDAEVQYQLGLLYTTAKPNPSKAEAHLDRAVELEPENADYHMALAQAVKSTKPEKAQEHLKAALRIRPDVASYILVAQWYRSSKAYKDSRFFLDQAAKLDPGNAEISLEKGLLWVDQKVLTQARVEFEKAIQLNPEDPRPAYYLQLITMDPKDPELQEPAQWAQKILSDPSDPEPHYALGMYYLKIRKFNFARMEAENLLRLNPKGPEGHWLTAETHLVQRNFIAAESELKWLMDHQPRHVKTLQIADSYYENTIKIKEWEAFYRNLFSAKKDALQLHYGLINIYSSIEDIDQMIQSYETVVSLEADRTKNAVNYSLLADLYVEKEDNKYAQLTIKRALRSDPNNKILKAKLEELKKPVKAPDFLNNIPGTYVKRLIIPSSRNWTKLHTAAAKGNLNKVKRLIGRGAEIDARNGEGLTPLQEAVKRNQMKVIEFLIENGADLHAASPQDQWQAIHLAAEYGRIEVLELLFSKGANLEARNSVGDTPLIVVVQLEWHKEDKVARFLVEKGAKVQAVNVFGCQALCYAAKNGNVALAKFLVAKGADINLTGTEGHTPLVMAILSENDELVEYLLEMGADATVKFEGSNLIKFASKRDLKRVVTLLKRAQ